MKARIVELLIGVAGVGLIAAGLGMIYWPLAPITMGVALLVELVTREGQP